MKNPYTFGELLYLRSPSLEDVEGEWHEWFSDDKLTRWLTIHNFPNSKEKQLDFFNSIKDSKEKLVLSIIDKASDKHIGVVSLSAINFISRTCEIAIIIGDSNFQKGTYLIEAYLLIIKIAFLRLNLRKITSYYASPHKTIEMLKKVFRFKRVGTLPEYLWDPKNGKYEDVNIAVLDREEWFKRNNYL